jgi:dimethylamine/trimethylamine dehydrogenase
MSNASDRFKVLFEPVRIGHLTAKNRFYQTPHCNGMGNLRPQAHAAMRRTKAEGGWAVINTEHCSVHPTSDLMPEVLQTLWDDEDIPSLQLMVDAVHEHGALAGVQLAYSAYYNANRMTREVPMGPDARPVSGYYPVQVRRMDKNDIRNLRSWWGDAARRAKTAGFDIINIDANFSTIAFQFLSPRNSRGDEYGGSLLNRTRLLRELIESTREAVGDSCAISVRLIVDELCGQTGLQVADEGLEAIRLLDDLPDLWDIVVGTWADDSPTSRFAAENDHEPFMLGIKQATRRPVVGVGRFTSPDTMASLIRRGILDMIGAARPSIADPFLPLKILEDRVDDIRECIGCNICVSSHYGMTNLRCTQNPTAGEEWRRGWHPERIRRKGSDTKVLVVGSGPAGLECARALGQRGYDVSIAEKETTLGGRVSRESKLPGLQEWSRVRDWRLGQLRKMSNVSVYPSNELTAQDALSLEHEHIVLATGSSWRRDGVGRATYAPPAMTKGANIFTPDDVMSGARPTGRVVIYDDDHYYLGPVLAELLAQSGADVTLVTPAADVSAFTAHTLELARTARLLHSCRVRTLTHQILRSVDITSIEFQHVHTAVATHLEADSVVLVTARLPDDQLYHDLLKLQSQWTQHNVISVERIGDCLAPAAIFGAVYSGHRFAQEFGAPDSAAKRERLCLTD